MYLTLNECERIAEDYMKKTGYNYKWKVKDTVFAILTGGIYNPFTKDYVDGIRIGIGAVKEIIAKN